ncbi:MAG: MerR family transcriptional regulator [Geobacter sp.]|nr:MAG: MerR family transcriptional regulator [Geobacter sp.]
MYNETAQEPDISIGDLAKTIGLTTRTLRYYEEMGIMAPPRRLDGGIRVYTPKEVRKLKFILKLKELGLTLKEMQELDAAYAEARETDKIIPRLIEMLDFHINGIDEKMGKLASLRKEIVDYRQRMVERFQLNMK